MRFERRARSMQASLPIEPELATRVDLDYYRRGTDTDYIFLALSADYTNLAHRLTTERSLPRLMEKLGP